MTILETKNLSKHFLGVTALDRLSLAIEQGTITSIIGPNGSGKTTLTNVLSGMLPMDEGVLVVQAQKLTKIKPYESAGLGITRTFQDVRLFNQMTVLDNLLVVLTERNIFGALFERHGTEHVKKSEAILDQVGLLAKKDDLAVNLSYGQQKLLELGRSLAMDAEIYIFDEIFAGLFPGMIKIVVKIFKALRKNGKTIIMIEHNMDLIRELSDFVFVLDSGQLLAHGQPEEVLAKKEVIEAYLGE